MGRTESELKKVYYKVAVVSDEFCQDCHHNFEGECRAYVLPHTKEEREQRLDNPVKCRGKPSVTRRLKI